MKLRVAHLPQIPCEAFFTDVKTVAEGVRIMDLLCSYDDFQFVNNIKPDYSSVSFLEMFDDESGEWESWMNEETGEDDPHQFIIDDIGNAA